jgi:hypothetical protein
VSMRSLGSDDGRSRYPLSICPIHWLLILRQFQTPVPPICGRTRYVFARHQSDKLLATAISRHAARFVSSQAKKAIQERDPFTMALSGGNTPRLLG